MGRNGAPLKMSTATALSEGGGQGRRGSILAQPAHRIPITSDMGAAKSSRRRVSTILADREAKAINHNPEPREEDCFDSSKLKKEPRRRTIYVPSEDTTIMTIHPGASLKTHDTTRRRPAQEPDFGLDLVTLSEEDSEHQPQESRTKRAPRKSLAAAPKRAPLQQSSRPIQSISTTRDVAGRGGGKENIPPGGLLYENKGKKEAADIVITIKNSKSKGSKTHHDTSSRHMLEGSTATSRVKAIESHKRTSSDSAQDSDRVKLLKARHASSSSAERRAKSVLKTSRPSSLKLSPLSPRRSPTHRVERNRRPEKVPSKLTLPLVAQLAEQQEERFPILLDDISRPELYEDSWLNHQEAAITQLINSLFESADGPDACVSHEDGHGLRKEMLQIYHQPSIPLLHKRLQASFLYGALSIPKELQSRALRLKDDLGMRRKYLDLWLETYQLPALKAAAEVVIGRESGTSPRLSNGSAAGDDRRAKAEKRAVEAFLDTFLVRNDDGIRAKGVGTIGSIARGGDGFSADVGSQGWSWRRTLLRSLMVILLLDQAKSSGCIPGCLFQTSSPYKSSTAILLALSSTLLPSLGDITRPLSHLNYQVQHTQYPLQEYSYRIKNLATDLRDGVRLTHLVELLLYPPSSLVQGQETVTVTMPTGEILSSLQEKDSWVLSQHLKFPCLGRAQKTYNVQVALSAVQGVRGIGAMIEDITADDIVDGYREKTIGLLWGLVGKWGLSTLIDGQQLEKEIGRLQKKAAVAFGEDYESEEDDELEYLEGLERYRALLRAWARIIGRLHGLRVSNLTTSFADGKVFEAIVDEYESYLPVSSCSGRDAAGDQSRDLQGKLRRLGCSRTFGTHSPFMLCAP
ncbi:MAG: hypothetical protein M1819_004870 [Sarea resinae]|nr:MAG: hypothetical protein M1819_004870 [Sarea resinae]